jgi:hypothetical protein
MKESLEQESIHAAKLRVARENGSIRAVTQFDVRSLAAGFPGGMIGSFIQETHDVNEPLR